MAYVKREIAEKIAAAEVEGVTVAQVRAILQQYLSALTTCSVCGGTGSLDFPQKVQMDNLRDRNGDALYVDHRVIAAGTTCSCFRCGPGFDGQIGSPGHDPEHVVWHCTEGATDYQCRHSQRGDQIAQTTHAKCGYRIMLPLDPSGPDS